MAESKKCRFCLRQEVRGIEVWGVFMCNFCEKDLLTVPVGGERYMHFLEVLKEAKQSCRNVLTEDL